MDYYSIVLFKAQLGEPFLGIWMFFFSSFFVIFSFFSSLLENRHLRPQNRQLSSQTGALKNKRKDQKDQNRHLRARPGT